ncbi:MAG: hypothetical protein AAF862_10560, partial [Pseudomonadota bacterium]
ERVTFSAALARISALLVCLHRLTIGIDRFENKRECLALQKRRGCAGLHGATICFAATELEPSTLAA